MKISNKVLLLLLAGSVTLSSCKKDEEEPEPTPAPTPAAPSNPIPAPSSAFGALVAIQTANYVTVPFLGEINQPIGLGVAVFGNLVSPGYVDGGTVTLNGSALTKQSNSSYVYTPSATNATGIDLGDESHWVVSGNSTTTVPALDLMTPRSMPTGPKFSGSTTIPINAEFTLS